MGDLCIGGIVIQPEYTVVRSRRKTISLGIDRDLQVVVRCPRRMPGWQVEEFVQRHKDWLEKHLAQAKAQQERRDSFSFSQGEIVYLWGQAHTIAAENAPCEAADGKILHLPGATEEERKEACLELLRREAREALPARTAFFGEQMELCPNSVKITSARRRWGSCSGRGGICFSLWLACLPRELGDYVVVHELAHLREMNHSPRFYRLVEEILPDYRERQKRLREWQKKVLF